jgi:phospholipid/cholesterol/gamma-HCH transport system ATP-binding protein
LILAKDLTVSYAGRPALGPLSGAFGDRSLVVAGQAQSGKNTLLKALCGLLPPTTGTVIVDGRPLTRATPAERAEIRGGFGMVFQGDALFDSMNALENVALPRLRRGEMRAQAHAQARRVLAEVGLAGHERVLPERLSGGMRKRLGLARALVARPRYLLADDPVAGLDPGTTTRVLELLFRLWRGRGGLIVATADPLPLWQRCDEVLILAAGQPLARGAPAAVRADPRVAQLLGEGS